MLNVLSGKKHPSSKPTTTKVVPFSKPLGYFPPYGGIPLNIPDSIPITAKSSQQTLDLQGLIMSYPAVATLQELELGTVTTINEEIYEEGSSILGQSEGIYVASSSENGSSHHMMMAMTVSFNNNNNGDHDEKIKDGLRFFGVHRTDVNESHVAVIGGFGKFHNANGYASIKTINGNEDYKVLLFNVYLG